jgi:hypothetical protein
MQTAAGPDLAMSSCSQTVDAYCAAVGTCKRDVATASMAATWCPNGNTGTVTVTLQHCAGSQTLISTTYSDSTDHLVYDSSGALVAVFSSVSHTTDFTCVAGPAKFAAPSGCDAASQLCS